MSVKGVQRRAEQAQRGIEAPAMSVYQRQLVGYEIERTPRVRPDGRTLWAGCGSRPAPARGQSTSKEVDTDGSSA